MDHAKVDPEVLKQVSLRVFGALSGAMTSAMIHLGDRLGLFRALASGGPTTTEQLAARTGLSERWVREWAYQQGAAGILETREGDTFGLSPEAACVLADERHPAFGCGPFASLPATLAVLPQLAESFGTGIGLPYDAFGPEGAAGIERGLAPWLRSLLVPVALPKVRDACARLEQGISVADVGCGAGAALIAMAKAYPRSRFHGYDISQHALGRARANVARAGVANVEIHDASRSPLPDDGRFDFMTTFDCLHDMTDPAGTIRSIRRALADDGIWLVCEIKAHPTYSENVARNPMAALMYGFSVMSCMSSALSEPGGAGLGTLGLHRALAEKLAREAGFTRFEPLELGHPVNTFYVVRP
jgi:SAM-dependent methyltransferase